jgi:hypothetical protein
MTPCDSYRGCMGGVCLQEGSAHHRRHTPGGRRGSHPLGGEHSADFPSISLEKNAECLSV